MRDYYRDAGNKGPPVVHWLLHELYSWIQHSTVEGVPAEAADSSVEELPGLTMSEAVEVSYPVIYYVI